MLMTERDFEQELEVREKEGEEKEKGFKPSLQPAMT